MVATAAMVNPSQLVQEVLSTTRMVQQTLVTVKHVQLVIIVLVQALLITHPTSARQDIIVRLPHNTKLNSLVRQVHTIPKSTKQV